MIHQIGKLLPTNVKDALNHVRYRIDYQLSTLKRFPTEIYINMTTNCNARCVFCSYNDTHLPNAQTTTLADIRQMKWLKHAKFIGLWCGNGEPLMNPEFEDILDYVNLTYPKAITHLSTNGALLTHRIAQKLDYLNVSLNAATAETWKRTNRIKGNFERTVDVIHQITKPQKSISFVMYADNLHELPMFVELAHRLKASAVFGHCMFHSWSGQRAIGIEKSCYLQKARTNDLLTQVHTLAKELRVVVFTPPLFGEPHYICRGTPVSSNMPYCPDPFKRLYLTVDEFGKPSLVVCCSGVYFNISYDIHNMTTENLFQVWNHPTFKSLRATVNKPLTGGNKLCRWCKTVDRYHPSAEVSYEHIKSLVRENKWYD